MNDFQIGKRILRQRCTRRMSQKKLARHLGVHFSDIHDYETGLMKMPAGHLSKTAEILETPLSYFYDPTPMPEIEATYPKSWQADMYDLLSTKELLSGLIAPGCVAS